MKSGFHQMEIEEESKHITAFIAPDRITGCLLDMSTHSPCTSEASTKQSENERQQALIYNYIDDVIIPFKTEEGFQYLEKVLTTLSSASFTSHFRI
jgi:hypothetical protein